VLAIDEINLYDNTSVLFDEQLSLRIGEVPLTCRGPGCVLANRRSASAAAQAVRDAGWILCFSKEGPGMVYSEDIQFTDLGVKSAFKKIPIVILGDGEKLVMEGFATKRVGKDHTKWQAGTLCGYKNQPSLAIGEACDGCGKCVEGLPPQYSGHR